MENNIEFRDKVTIFDVANGIVGLDVKILKDGQFIGTESVLVAISIDEARKDYDKKSGQAWSKRNLLLECFKEHAQIILDSFDSEVDGETNDSEVEVETKGVKDHCKSVAVLAIVRYLETVKRY